MKKTDIEILAEIKKLTGARNNQELLNKLNMLSDVLRKKVCQAVYLTDTKYRIKLGNERFKETIPEADYLK